MSFYLFLSPPKVNVHVYACVSACVCLYVFVCRYVCTYVCISIFDIPIGFDLHECAGLCVCVGMLMCVHLMLVGMCMRVRASIMNVSRSMGKWECAFCV